MAYGKISAKQKEILEYIKQEILNKGYPPAVREICEAVDLKSTSSVHSHLETLEKNGYIRRDPTKPRAIEIMDDNFNLTRREVTNVPIIGNVAAGQPLLAVENIENYFPIPVELPAFMTVTRFWCSVSPTPAMEILWLRSWMIRQLLRLFIRKTVIFVCSQKMIRWIRLSFMIVRFWERYLVCFVSFLKEQV